MLPPSFAYDLFIGLKRELDASHLTLEQKLRVLDELKEDAKTRHGNSYAYEWDREAEQYYKDLDDA